MGVMSQGEGAAALPPPKKIGAVSFLGSDKNLGRRGFWC